MPLVERPVAAARVAARSCRVRAAPMPLSSQPAPCGRGTRPGVGPPRGDSSSTVSPKHGRPWPAVVGLRQASQPRHDSARVIRSPIARQIALGHGRRPPWRACALPRPPSLDDAEHQLAEAALGEPAIARAPLEVAPPPESAGLSQHPRVRGGARASRLAPFADRGRDVEGSFRPSPAASTSPAASLAAQRSLTLPDRTMSRTPLLGSMAILEKRPGLDQSGSHADRTRRARTLEVVAAAPGREEAQSPRPRRPRSAHGARPAGDRPRASPRVTVSGRRARLPLGHRPPRYRSGGRGVTSQQESGNHRRRDLPGRGVRSATAHRPPPRGNPSNALLILLQSDMVPWRAARVHPVPLDGQRGQGPQ